MNEDGEPDLPHAPRRPRSLVPPWAAAAVLVLACVVAYGNSLSGPFILDDHHAIRDNPAIRLSGSLASLAEGLLASMRPVTDLTFAANYAIGGWNVRGYHMTNLAIHVLATLILFDLVRRLLLSPRWRAPVAPVAPGLALAVAGLWAVHPLTTQAVTYVVQRAESLAALLYLLTLYGVARAASARRRWLWAVLAVGACALGMGAKPTMATAPLAALLLDGAFFAGSPLRALRRRWPIYAGLAACWGILGALLAVVPAGPSAGADVAAFTPWTYALTQLEVIPHYLRLSFWPRGLCLDYGWPAAASPGAVWPEAILVAALLAGTAVALWRRPMLGAVAGVFWLLLAPTSSVLPIADAAAEHRMYLPLAAVIALAVLVPYVALMRAAGRFTRSRVTRFVLLHVLPTALILPAGVALLVATRHRNADYQTARSIWQDTVEKAPAPTPRPLLENFRRQAPSPANPCRAGK